MMGTAAKEYVIREAGTMSMTGVEMQEERGRANLGEKLQRCTPQKKQTAETVAPMYQSP